MRSFGDINNVTFINKGWKLTHLAYKYKLTYNGNVYTTYVTTMSELREEIADLIKGQTNEG